jgi:hypothetical protein
MKDYTPEWDWRQHKDKVFCSVKMPNGSFFAVWGGIPKKRYDDEVRRMVVAAFWRGVEAARMRTINTLVEMGGYKEDPSTLKQMETHDESR